MKNNHLFKSVASALGYAAFSSFFWAVAHSGAAQGATISITPTGAQLDGDAILDIVLQPGEQLIYNVFFDNSADALSTHQLEYDFSYDSNELTFVKANLDVSNKFLSEGTLATPGNIFVFHVDPSGSLGLAPQAKFLLNTLEFVGKNVEHWPGNGEYDAKIINGVNRNAPVLGDPPSVISNFSSNENEVQKVPAPLPILGTAFAFRSARKLRKLSSKFKTFSVG